MLNEQASSSLDQPIWRQTHDEQHQRDSLAQVRPLVSTVLAIHNETAPDNQLEDEDTPIELMLPDRSFIGSFEGKLLIESEQAYSDLDTLLQSHDWFALFRETGKPDSPHLIYVVQGRVNPTEGRGWLNLVLFLVTLASVFIVGAGYGIAGMLEPDTTFPNELSYGVWINGLPFPRLSEIWRGAPYALSIMAILGAHELGHYFAARYHKISVSLPYFIPMPLTFLGTMGAVIRSREPMRNRKVLMDIGAAGPLAGMVFAIPILYIGLATSNIEPMAGAGLREGNSLLYAGLKVLALGQFFPTATHDVVINQMALAGWLGLLVTALNLIPVGQLDGGHVLYSLFGMRARAAYYPILLGMVFLAIRSPEVWMLWVILLFFLGRLYAPPLDDITPLDNRRRGWAIFTLLIFIVVFVPTPFSFYQLEDVDPAPEANVYQMPAADEMLYFTIDR